MIISKAPAIAGSAYSANGNIPVKNINMTASPDSTPPKAIDFVVRLIPTLLSFIGSETLCRSKQNPEEIPCFLPDQPVQK